MTGQQEAPRVVTLTMDQLVAINVQYWRRQQGLTQPELGLRMGWSAGNVSAIERSADEGREPRRFNAQALAELSIALGVPLAALFLPPPDDGDKVAYQFTAGGRLYGMGDLMEHVVMPDTVTEGDLIEAYRQRFNKAAMRAARGPRWADLVARWMGGGTMRVERAARLRRRAADLAAASREFAELATAIEDGKDGQ